MNTQILNVIEDPEIGDIGLHCEGMRKIEYPMAAFSGLIIAHDLLEHQRGVEKIGTIGDELVALGGVWYVRGRWGEISRWSIYPPHANIASDVNNMARMNYYGTKLHFVPPPQGEHILDDDFREIIEISKNEIEDELDSDEPVDWDWLNAYYHHALDGLRLGYDMAEQRYEGRCALSLFRSIEEAVDNLFPMVYTVGQRFELKYNDYEAQAHPLEEWD